jgi:hypothetical protein
MKVKIFLPLLLILLNIGVNTSSFGMGLRTFVALPVEKGGKVVRFRLIDNKITTALLSSGAYGITSKKTLLMGLPYRLSPSGSNRLGDVSLMYRQITLQNDSAEGTNRLGLLGGAVISTNSNRDSALQGGFVFTHFKNKNEIDVDFIYQKGLGERLDNGRYDLSWQHRLLPKVRPDWGFSTEINSVIELNGRWKESNSTTHQLTLGLQKVYKTWVLESGVTKDINKNHDVSYLLSTRFNF